MRRPLLALSLVSLASAITACVPPRERVAGRSRDGGTVVELDLRPAAGDSVLGTGTLRVAGRPHTVVLRGRWNEQTDGMRRLAATLQADTMPGERWSLEWSPVSLDGTLRHAETGGEQWTVSLATID